MIASLAGRVVGPAATLALLGYLAGFPPEYTASYAVLAAYMQFATAPLNPYTEHFHLREMLSGRKGGLGAGLGGLGLIWLVSSVLVLGLGESPWMLAVLPVLGLGHLLTKVVAARLRAGHHNGVALGFEFTLRPLVLVFFVVLLFEAAGPSEARLTWAFALTGLVTIALALLVAPAARSLATSANAEAAGAPATANSSPWAFVFLGMLMVLATQFEVFALSRLAEAEALATYKVALQLASICGIATNFILLTNLRELYAHSAASDTYRAIFRKVQLQALAVSAIFAVTFAAIGFGWPVLWDQATWLLTAAAAAIFATSAAFGPLANWFYSTGQILPIVLSFVLMVTVKLAAISCLQLFGAIGPESLMVVYGLGVITHNLFLLEIKSKAHR